MEKIKKIAYAIVVILVIYANVQKFGYKVEINDLELIRMMGLDADIASNGAKIRLTYLRNPIEKESGGSSSEESTAESSKSSDSSSDVGGIDGEKSTSLTMEAPTYNTAVKEFIKVGEKVFVINSVKYYLIGEETARAGILQEVDFISRSYEFRLDSRLFITKGMTSEEMMKKADPELYRKIDNVISNSLQMAYVRERTLVDILHALNSTNSSNVIPVLEINNVTGASEINITDLAIFKKDKLVDYLSGNEVIDYSIFATKIKAFPITVEAEEYGHVTAAVADIEKTMDFEFDGDNIKKIKFKIKLFVNIEDMDRQQNLMNIDITEKIQAQIGAQITDRLYKLTDKMKNLKSDFIRISDKFDSLYPNRWTVLRNNWDETIANAEFEINVDVLAMRTYDIKESTRY